MLQATKENKHRAGDFKDQRFGEEDPNMTEEDKMLERFVREKRRKTERHSLYHLNDNEEDASLLTLTHGGRHLDALSYDDDELGGRLGGRPYGDDEDEDGHGGLDDAHVRQLHFGGFREDAGDFEPTQQRDRSYKEIMAEVIAKSKMHKVILFFFFFLFQPI